MVPIKEQQALGFGPGTMPEPIAPSPRAQAEALRIRVSEGKQIKADVTLRAACAANLAELVPPEVNHKLTQRRIDVRQIAQKAVAEEFPPGELFRLEEGEKDFRVWLE